MDQQYDAQVPGMSCKGKASQGRMLSDKTMAAIQRATAEAVHTMGGQEVMERVTIIRAYLTLLATDPSGAYYGRLADSAHRHSKAATPISSGPPGTLNRH